MRRLIYLSLLTLILTVMALPQVTYAATKAYTISKKTTVSDKYKKAKDYSTATKDYYIFRTVFDQCTDNGGGEITIKKGAYTITKPIYISTNTSVVLADGVTITKSLDGTKSIFQLISYKNAGKKGYYSGYSGEHDITITGEGSATIDMNYYERGVGIVIGHSKNITIKNIHFMNLYGGHFIEMDACQNALIDGCSFENAKEWGKTEFKEAINIDTPDLATNGFNNAWSSHDKTPDSDVHITNCLFKNLQSGIGTHSVSKDYNPVTKLYDIDKWHTNITIDYCQFINITRSSLRMYAWKDSIVSNNEFTNETKQGTIMEGWCTNNFTFKLNTMNNVQCIGYMYAINHYGKDQDGNIVKMSGQDYEPNYSYFYEQNIKDFYNNTAINMDTSDLYIHKSVTNDTVPKDFRIYGNEMKAE